MLTPRGKSWLWFALLLLVGPVVWGQTVIEGVVRLPPANAKLPPRIRYPGQVVQPAAPEPPTAVVYLEGDFSATPSATNALAELGQRDLQFTAGLFPIQTGTRVVFPNHDDLYHNVFSYSKPKRFDLGRYQKDETPPAIRFNQAGVVKLYCEIHEHMRSTILVLDTPYFTKTDSNGTYRLTGLPSGRFRLKAWLDERSVRETGVDLQPNARLQVNFDSSAP